MAGIQTQPNSSMTPAAKDGSFVSAKVTPPHRSQEGVTRLVAGLQVEPDLENPLHAGSYRAFSNQTLRANSIGDVVLTAHDSPVLSDTSGSQDTPRQSTDVGFWEAPRPYSEPAPMSGSFRISKEPAPTNSSPSDLRDLDSYNDPCLLSDLSFLQDDPPRPHSYPFPLQDSQISRNELSLLQDPPNDYTEAPRLHQGQQNEDSSLVLAAKRMAPVVLEQELGFSGECVHQGWSSFVLNAVWQTRDVSVKVQIRREKAEDGFNRELVDAAHRPRHPNVVDFLGSSTFDEMPALVYESLPGGTVEEVLLRKRCEMGKAIVKPPLLLALSWGQQMFCALEFLHHATSFGSHRDVKPSNLLLSADLKQLKLADQSRAGCGLLEEEEEDDDDDEEEERQVDADSCRFLAPELSAGGRVAWDKADIYAGTMTLWTMLKGQLPFEQVDATLVPLMVAKGVRPPAPADKRGIARLLQAGWAASPSARPGAQPMCDAAAAELQREQSRGRMWRVIRGHSGKWV